MNEFLKRLIKLADHYRVSSPAAFAKKVGISHQSATNYLKGNRMPTIESLLQIHKAFEGLSLEWLLNGTGEMLICETVINHPDSTKDLEISYLKQLVQSQKALIQVLSEKAGIDLTELSAEDQNTESKKEKPKIKGFRAFDHKYFGSMISNLRFNYQ